MFITKRLPQNLNSCKNLEFDIMKKTFSFEYKSLKNHEKLSFKQFLTLVIKF